MRVKLENGKRYTPKDSDKVECQTHGVVTTWGALDGIQQLALSEGLDVGEDLPCIMAPSRHPQPSGTD